MWTSENERQGFKRCTRMGYALICFATLLLPLGAVGLLALGVYVAIDAYSQGLSMHACTVLAVPLACLVLGALCQWGGRALARRQGFSYDYPTDTCRWKGM